MTQLLGTWDGDAELVSVLLGTAAVAALVGDRVHPDYAPEDTMAGPWCRYRLNEEPSEAVPLGGEPTLQQLVYLVEFLVPEELGLEPVRPAVLAAVAALDGHSATGENGVKLSYYRLGEVRLQPAQDQRGQLWLRSGLRVGLDAY